MKIVVTHIEKSHFPQETSEIIATFDAKVGDFKVRRGTLRQGYDRGNFFIGTGGGTKQRTGITLGADTETRAALIKAVADAYKELRANE